jgi:hypothetical protein
LEVGFGDLVEVGDAMVRARREGREPGPRHAARSILQRQPAFKTLLGNDAIGVDGLEPVVARIGRAWETVKHFYLGTPQNRVKARALRAQFDRFERREQQMRGNGDLDARGVAAVRLR